jgi:predicted ABC-type ATPase
LAAEEILNIRPTKSKQRAELHRPDSWVAARRMVTHPPFRDAQAIGNFLRAQQSFTGLQGVSDIQRKNRDDSATDGPVPPILLLLVGASGSGKSTFYENHLQTAFPMVLKASASPLEQPETDDEWKRLLKMGESFVYQDVIFNPQQIREAKSAGYQVKAVYVATEDPTLNFGRILIRISNGGAFAAISRIPRDFSQGTKQLTKIRKLADDLMLFDNTPHERGVHLIAHFHEGVLVKLARIVPKWAQRVFEAEFEKSLRKG